MLDILLPDCRCTIHPLPAQHVQLDGQHTLQQFLSNIDKLSFWTFTTSENEQLNNNLDTDQLIDLVNLKFQHLDKLNQLY